MILNIIFLCLFSGKTCTEFCFLIYIHLYLYLYRDTKIHKVFILLITVHNKAILTVTIIQAQNFASSRKYTLFVQISHTNKALIPPQILVWGQREVLGHLSETSILPRSPHGATIWSGLSEQSVWARISRELHEGSVSTISTANLFLHTLHSWTALETQACCASTDLLYKGDFLDWHVCILPPNETAVTSAGYVWITKSEI